MDHAAIKMLSEALDDVRIRYGVARAIVRDMRARETSNVEVAYWIGVAQSFSKQAADDLETLQDALWRLEMMTRPKDSTE